MNVRGQRTEDRGQKNLFHSPFHDKGIDREGLIQGLSSVFGFLSSVNQKAVSEVSTSGICPLSSVLCHLTSDSRAVRPGDTFVAYPGERQDGRKYIPDAIRAGCNAVLWERGGFTWNPSLLIPNLGVEDLRSKAGVIAEQAYGNPSEKLWMIGVTGTNGKTSCAHWLAQALTWLSRKSAVMGTLGNGFAGSLTPSPNTTPDALELHRQLREYLDAGAQCVAMEVSSHGLAQGRVNGVHFDVALLTNLSRDHLDYHGDMAAYATTKASLFGWPGLKYAVLNLDDPFGAELAGKLGCSGVQVVGYSLEGNRENAHFAILARKLRLGAAGIAFEVATPWGTADLASPLLGRFNAQNLLATLAGLLVSGVALAEAIAALERIQPVAGRMQKLGGSGKPLVVVDYAHTPDALEKVLATLKEVAAGRLICVFGCGGGRDKGKRPLMGAAASRLADAVIVTSDNPRHEDPQAIINDIVAGMNANYHVMEDRALAICEAIRQAAPHDVVLIAGKGHEEYQEMNGTKLPFSDTDVAQRVLQDYTPC
ncbi:MAG: UDP-N-acetylmuramoyl-L-alanyl-D-glutamate--2,6-diaminopimelate ligase [Sulfuricellaceae bacterium]